MEPLRHNVFIPDAARLPTPARAEEVARGFEAWLTLAEKQKGALRAFMLNAAENHGFCALLACFFGYSPYLTRLAMHHPDILLAAEERGLETAFEEILASLAPVADTPQLMRQLRIAKGKIALLVASADLCGAWALPEVTAALSRFADASVELALAHLLTLAAKRGEITLPVTERPTENCGIIVLGMGKLGALELNYSSDIDLIVFFEPERLGYKGRHSEQKFMNKLAQDLVHILQERTPDGYVFRTDLRLRPDPASTPPAINTEAAVYYYESVGQNWERAAMIKARAIAGDLAAGVAFMQRIAPFMWRRNLDFAAINDIHSIKRQMDTKSGRTIVIAGHNVKLGMGGIREIEFFTQIHQLIWGGREPSLRTRGTCETLSRLRELGIVPEETVGTLLAAYPALRMVEHRLQMVADQQTHTLPTDNNALIEMAQFSGFENLDLFSHTLGGYMHQVHRIFASSFKSAEKLGDEGNLVFTGVSHDPDTLETIARMGFAYPPRVSETVMGWHHGSRRCTRTKRARELLTELMPALLKRLSETADPDTAFLRFDEFLKHMPAGVQLFSLFTQNPELLTLIADIMGSAPVLAEHLSKHPALLDSVLFGGFYGPLDGKEALAAQLEDILKHAGDFEERMESLARFKNERQFQAGVQLLKGMTDAAIAGRFLADLADVLLAAAVKAVGDEFAASYGRIVGSRFCVLGLGRLGCREMTFASDIDLVFVYDVPDFETLSDGEKRFSASVYFNRFTQRLMSALTTAGAEGRLYEVDTRLRPSGKQGLLAVSKSAFSHYFEEMAWTFEFMALSKARVAAGDASLASEMAALIRAQLAKPREAEALKRDVVEMHGRLEKEFTRQTPWELKHAPGGIMDVDFIAQYLLLLHAQAHPVLAERARASAEVFGLLAEEKLLDAGRAEMLAQAAQFLFRLQSMLRLTTLGEFDEDEAMPGLKRLLARECGQESFEALKAELVAVEKRVREAYSAVLGNH